MSVYRQVIDITTDSSGSGTATTREPVVGEVLSVRYDGTAFGGTAHFTITRPPVCCSCGAFNGGRISEVKAFYGI